MERDGQHSLLQVATTKAALPPLRIGTGGSVYGALPTGERKQDDGGLPPPDSPVPSTPPQRLLRIRRRMSIKELQLNQSPSADDKGGQSTPRLAPPLLVSLNPVGAPKRPQAPGTEAATRRISKGIKHDLGSLNVDFPPRVVMPVPRGLPPLDAAGEHLAPSLLSKEVKDDLACICQSLDTKAAKKGLNRWEMRRDFACELLVCVLQGRDIDIDNAVLAASSGSRSRLRRGDWGEWWRIQKHSAQYKIVIRPAGRTRGGLCGVGPSRGAVAQSSRTP